MTLFKFKKNNYLFLFLVVVFLFVSLSAFAETQRAERTGIIKKILERKNSGNNDEKLNTSGLYTKGIGKSYSETLDNRNFITYVPIAVRKKGNIPLLVVLHGGFGNASQIKNYVGLEPFADKNGFMIVYIDGTKVARGMSDERKGWNGGGCCGLPQQNKVDDIGYIKKVINHLKEKYGIDPKQVYGTGHSNGAIMTLRILCETDLYKAGVTYSGTLQLDVKTCPKARGAQIMNIHGSDDKNLPVSGGHTTTGINKITDYKSQAYTKDVFLRSGAQYELLLLQGAAHKPETLNDVLLKKEGISLPQKIVTTLSLDK